MYVYKGWAIENGTNSESFKWGNRSMIPYMEGVQNVVVHASHWFQLYSVVFVKMRIKLIIS